MELGLVIINSKQTSRRKIRNFKVGLWIKEAVKHGNSI